MAAITGRLAWLRLESAPLCISRRISMPTTRKKMVISTSLTKKCRSVLTVHGPRVERQRGMPRVEVALCPRRVGPEQGHGCGDEQHDAAHGLDMQHPAKASAGTLGCSLQRGMRLLGWKLRVKGKLLGESTYALLLVGKCRSNRFGKHTPRLKQARERLRQRGLKASVGGMAKRVRMARIVCRRPDLHRNTCHHHRMWRAPGAKCTEARPDLLRAKSRRDGKDI